MRIVRGVRTAALVVGLTGLACGRGRLPIGQMDPADASLDPEAPAPSVLEVLVLDDRPFVGTGDPVQGAEVLLDDAGGRRSASTDADGRVTFEGAPTDGSASLTVWADGFVALTIAGLGAQGLPVPSPLRIGLGTLAYCQTCLVSFDAVTGEIAGRSRPSSPVTVSLAGTWAVSNSERYVTPAGPWLTPGARMLGLELARSVEGGARVVGVADTTWDGRLEGPPLVLRPVEAGELGEATIECELAEPRGALRAAVPQIAIIDELTGGIPDVVLGLSSTPQMPGRTSIEYVLSGRGEPGVLASAFDVVRSVGARSGGSVDSGPLVLREPPVLAPPADGELSAGTALELSGAEWATEHARFFVLERPSTGEVLWVVLPPPGASGVALPAPPDGPSWSGEGVVLAAVAARWNGDPWPDYLVVAPGWARSHLLELSHHSTAARFR